MDGYCAFGAEFLAAEAADALLFRDFRLALHDAGRAGGADLGAFAAADAHGAVYPRPRAEAAAQEGPEPGALALEIYLAVPRRLLEVGDCELVRVAGEAELAPVRRAEAARDALRHGGRVGGVEADEVRADEVGVEGRVGGQDGAHVPGRTVAGAIPLHAVHGVHEREPRRVIEREVAEHGAELLHALVQVVLLGLARAGDGAEEVLHGAGHVGHAVGLELSEVDDGVRLLQPGGVGEALHRLALGEAGLHALEVLVELAAGFPDRLHARPGVNRVYPRRGEGPAGAVADDDARAEADKYAREGREAFRVGDGGALGRHARYEVRLHGDGHAGLHPAEAAQRLRGGEYGGLHAAGLVAPAADYADVYGHGFGLLSQ